MPKARITITIDEKLLKLLDQAKGGLSRSEFIERIVAEHLSEKPPREKEAAGGRALNEDLPRLQVEILREILEELREIKALLYSRPLHAPSLRREAVEEKSGEGGLPSFAAGNPWLKVLADRR